MNIDKNVKNQVLLTYKINHKRKGKFSRNGRGERILGFINYSWRGLSHIPIAKVEVKHYSQLEVETISCFADKGLKILLDISSLYCFCWGSCPHWQLLPRMAEISDPDHDQQQPPCQ